MHAVVLWRLLLSARLTLANLEHIDMKGSDVQYAPVPDFKLQPGDLETMAANIGKLRAKAEKAVKALMDAMAKSAPGTPVALMIALDEGQRLDELHRGSEKRRSGAQWGLYVLRRFQKAMSRHKRVVLPIMTGIDPATYAHPTEGKNIVLGIKGSEAIITLEDAHTVVQQCVQITARTKKNVDDNRYCRRGNFAEFNQGLLVLMMHPRMRPMIEAIERNLTPIQAAGTAALYSFKEENNRVMLLIAAALGTPIYLEKLNHDRALIEQHFALRYDPSDPNVAWPVMDCVVWRRLRPSSDVDDMFVISMSDPVNPKTFQDLSFTIISYYLQVYGPLLPELAHSCADNDPLVKAESRHTVNNLLQWLDLKKGTTPLKVEVLKLNDGESVMQPFKAGDRARNEQKTDHPHDDTPPTQYSAVTKEFKGYIKSLKVGCGVWVRCTTRSPLDYLLVVRASASTAFIRFVDAKHTHQLNQLYQSNQLNLNKLDRYIYDRLLPKAQMVHDELKRLLFMPLHITLEPFSNVHVAIVTNARDGVRATDAVVFCPTTFLFEPWTSYLYSDSIISKTEEEEEEEEE